MGNALVKKKMFQSIAGILTPPISLKSFNGGGKLSRNKGIKINKGRKQIRFIY